MGMFREKKGRGGIVQKEGGAEAYPARREPCPEHRHPFPPEVAPAGRKTSGHPQCPGSSTDCRRGFRDRRFGLPPTVTVWARVYGRLKALFRHSTNPASRQSAGDGRRGSNRNRDHPQVALRMITGAAQWPLTPARAFSKISLICLAIMPRPIDCLADAPKPPS
jgi:hypothetical protein